MVAIMITRMMIMVAIAAMKIMKRMAIRLQVSHLLAKPSFQFSFYSQDLDPAMSDLYHKG